MNGGLDLKRSLNLQGYDNWLGLLYLLNDCALIDNKADKVFWELEKKKTFTTKFLYRFLTNRGGESVVKGLGLYGKVRSLKT